ncbi:MAG: MBL fold metallo-hydrolase [Paludibacter sp.]|jgi:glyoxylase-like metal-dependent hydrolase (beta-lactamase superfamily II)|nr:MBL fold metallo-hydrolase [Paludibacter sp.]
MKLYTIEAGYFNADGGACFGVVPKRVWQKRYPCDENNFCRLNMRCLLIDTGERRILIDTGAGTKQLDYFKLYGMKELIDFETELPKIGYTTDDITDVILTHLHFDHCGGCTRYGDGKSVELAFKNAYYWVSEAQWKNFLNPNVREGDSYFLENMLPVKEAGRLKLVTEPVSLTPDVQLKLFNGHTVGQIVTYIQTPTTTFVYSGDVIPIAPNVPLAWVSSYDTFPITSMAEKKVLLDEAIAKSQVLIFEHDAYTECCTVTESGGKYKVGKTGTLKEFMSN